jgi:precorrin-6B methylase 2
MTPQERRRTLLMSTAAAAVAGTGLALAPTGIALAQEGAPGPEALTLDVPFVPTPQEVVDRMLALAKVSRTDTLYDLGCGDGRIVVTAASQFGARGVGIDLNPERIAEAQANAKKAGVEQRVSLRVGDLFDTDLSPATVVSLYLLPDVNLKLRPRLWSQLKPGARVVSHAFDMGPEWPPEQTIDVGGRTIYLWTITMANKTGRKVTNGVKTLSRNLNRALKRA